ncbi:MAG: alpha/beta hydrolase-fold protein [Niabella sp.]
MTDKTSPYFVTERCTIPAKKLKRDVIVDFFLPTCVSDTAKMSLLLINDGQDMAAMGFSQLLHGLYEANAIQPILCAAIRCGEERTLEYGVAAGADYLNRGSKAGDYTHFVIKQLLPYIHKTYNVKTFKETAFAGFSLGGLSALDIVWKHPGIFSRVGVFSGSLWWRSKDQNDKDYQDHQHRMMQQQIRKGRLSPHTRFFFQCSGGDEAADRNHNGIIDAIEDTIDHIHELIRKGCSFDNIVYLNLPEGKHDVPTWRRAMIPFLKWGWGK